ncbi:MAG: AraC family transcriptional regulator [Planctomycetota bacterium]
MKFQVIQPMTAFFRPLCIEKEVQTDTKYYRRGPSDRGDVYCYVQYTLSGRGVYSDNSGIYSLSPGKMLLGDVTYHDYEYYYPKDAAEPWIFIWFGFLGEGASVAVAELIRRHGPVYDLPADRGAVPALMKYKSYNGLTYELTPFDGMTLVTDVLTDVAASRWLQHPEDSRSVLIRKTRKLIVENLGTPVRIGNLASQLCISREHLSRAFKEHTGITLQDYILRQKMSLACKLLKETNLSTKEVSARLGYDNPSQFTRSFKKLLHIPPSQFRRMRTNVVL